MNVRPLGLSEVWFDEQDSNLFLVDDARLRADALKHSILPRLQIVMHHAIDQIRTIYGIEVLEDSTVSSHPNFRTKRENELSLLYQSAFVGLGGKRCNKWKGFNRKDGTPVTILPFRFGITLQAEEFFFVLENGWLKGLSDNANHKMLQFLLEHRADIASLMVFSCVNGELLHRKNGDIILGIEEQLRACIKNRWFDRSFTSHPIKVPLGSEQLQKLVDQYVAFFPVYDSFIQLAKGKLPRIKQLIGKLERWLGSAEYFPEKPKEIEESLTSAAALAAEAKVPVMPALRWQVFQRDLWRCVSCGRNSHDGAILHVDHIIPRSLGGKDDLNNFQTLCSICNFGKSNRNSTDLRRQRTDCTQVS